MVISKLMQKVTQDLLKFKIVHRRNFSALYLTGNKAQTTYAVVKPHLDLDERLQHENLQENIELRGLRTNIKRLRNMWEMYKAMEEQKIILQVTRTEIGKLMTKLMEDEEKYRAEIVELKTKAKQIKNDFLNIRDYAYGLEETAAEHILNLPNILHPNTPKNGEYVIHRHLPKPEFKSKSHMEIAKNKNYIEYISPMFYFLTEDAALFEIGVTNYVSSCLKQCGYLPFSSADFSRSVVVEGCGTDFSDSSKVLTLRDPHDERDHELCRLHLTGGGTLYSFMAYFTKYLIQPSYLPLKLFSQGRMYQPVKNSDNVLMSLMSLNQYTVLTPFIATLDEDGALNDMLSKLQADVIKVYEALGYHFRIVCVSPKQLTKSESLRLSIQMFSNSLMDYCEVGNVSVYDSYLSKRLLVTYNVGKDRKFPRIISGCLLNVQKFLACALENNSSNDQPILTEMIKSYV